MKMLGMLPIGSVRPNKWNVNVIAGEEYARLKEAMRASGPEKTEPIVVRRAEDGAFEIVNGEQRWRIAGELGWKAIPALEVEVDRKEAKFLCLSYNALRGTVDFVKLSELLLVDPEMVEAAEMVYGPEKTKEFMESAKKLTMEAKETLRAGLKAGSKITPEKITAVAETPKEVQKLAAKAATQAEPVAVEFIKSSVEQFIHPEEEGEGEEEKEEGAEKKAEAKGVEGEGLKVTEQFRHYTIGGRAYEVVAFVDLDEPGTYAIFFDMENRTVGIKRHKVDFNVYVDQFTAPKLYKLTFKCKHGTAYNMEFDASTGEYKLEEAGEA